MKSPPTIFPAHTLIKKKILKLEVSILPKMSLITPCPGNYFCISLMIMQYHLLGLLPSIPPTVNQLTQQQQNRMSQQILRTERWEARRGKSQQ